MYNLVRKISDWEEIYDEKGSEFQKELFKSKFKDREVNQYKQVSPEIRYQLQ
jgi:hypothetical protein